MEASGELIRLSRMLGSKPSSRMGVQWEGHCKQGGGRRLSSCALRTPGDLVQGFGVTGLGFSYYGDSDLWTKSFSSLLFLFSLPLPLLLFGIRVCLCNPDCHRTDYIAQAGLRFLGVYP